MPRYLGWVGPVSRSGPAGPAWSRRGASSRSAGAPSSRGSGGWPGASRGGGAAASRSSVGQPLAGGPAVVELGPVLAGGHGEHAVDQPAGEPLERPGRAGRSGSDGDPATSKDSSTRRVGGVDALAARARRPREPLGQLRRRDRPGRRQTTQVVSQGRRAACGSRCRAAAARSTRSCPSTRQRVAAGLAELGDRYAVPLGQRGQPVDVGGGHGDQHPAGGLGEQRDERVAVDGHRRADVAAQHRLDQRLGQAAVGEVVGAGRPARPPRGAARPAPSRRRRSTTGGSPPRCSWTTCAHSEPDSSSRVSPSSSDRSPGGDEPGRRTAGDVVDHAEHGDHRRGQDRASRRSGCRG